MLATVPPSRALRLAALAVYAALAAHSAAAQPPPCGMGNPVTQCLDQETVGVVSTADDDEMLGAAVAFGDFDGDGFDDLAIGAPGERQSANGAGLVHVFYGTADGLTTTGSDQFDQASIAGESVEAGDGFGFALAAGDFDADGFDDLVIGAPFEDHGGCPLGCTNSGVLHVVYGAPDGLDLGTAETLTNDLGISGAVPADGNEFASTLAAGRVSNDSFDDLLVCAPGYDSDKGRCFVIFGGSGGIGPGSTALVSAAGIAETDRLGSAAARVDYGGVGLGGTPVFGDPLANTQTQAHAGAIRFGGLRIEEGDVVVTSGALNRFGQALATGDFNDDGFEDLAVGVPGFTSVLFHHGLVRVLLGEPGGLDIESIESVTLHEDNLLDPGDIEAGDLTGSALARGDFDGDGVDDLAIGTPGEDNLNVGRVLIAFGGAGGFDLARSLAFLQSDLGGANFVNDAMGEVLAAGDVDGDGRDELAIGVPLKQIGVHDDAGMVYIHSLPAPPVPPEIFEDGFESGDTSAWSETVP